MNALPQLKRIREERALSQRDLASMSGVAQDSISEIERGERQARPSTVRKLAAALGVDPSVLLAETTVDRFIAPEWAAFSQMLPEDRELIEPLMAEQERLARQAIEPLRAQQKRIERQSAAEEIRQREALNELTRLTEESLQRAKQHAFRQGVERGTQIVSAIAEYESGIARARSKMASGNPQDVLGVAELAKRNVDKIVSTLGEHSEKFGDFADWYYMGGQDVGAASSDPDMVLMEAAAEAAQEWLNFYNECLDWLDQEITMRRKEATSLEDYVMRLSQNQDRDMGERARGEYPTHTWRSN